MVIITTIALYLCTQCSTLSAHPTNSKCTLLLSIKYTSHDTSYSSPIVLSPTHHRRARGTHCFTWRAVIDNRMSDGVDLYLKSSPGSYMEMLS